MAEETKELSSKLQKLIDQIGDLTVLELADLVKALEEKFGVSATAVAAPMMAGAASGANSDAGPAEEKTEFTVVLTDAGANKINVIKVVRELVPTLGLKEAKDLVEAAPKTVLESAKKDAANEAKKKLEDAGAKVELK